MSVKTLIAMFASVATSFAALTIVHAAHDEKPSMQTATLKSTKSGHVAVNGVNYYYAVYGTGEPLLLLHTESHALRNGPRPAIGRHGSAVP